MSDVYQPPESELTGPGAGESNQGSIERALAGDFEFDVIDVLSEAWRLTNGVKLIFIVGALVVWVLGALVQVAAGMVLPGAEQGVAGSVFSSVVSGLAQLAVTAPLWGGIVLVAQQRSVGNAVEMADVFSQFQRAWPIIALSLVTTVLIYLGFLVLIVPGVYLAVAYVMAMPLLIDRNLPLWEAMETSRKVVTKCWWRMFLLGLLLVLILAVSALPLGIGLIWTVPLAILSIGVVYRNLFGVATPPAR